MYTANMLSYHAETIVRELQRGNMDYEEIRLLVKERLSQLLQEGRTARLKSGPYGYNDRKTLEEWKDQYQRYNTEDYYDGDALVSHASRKIGELFPDLEEKMAKSEHLAKEFIRQYPAALEELLVFNSNPEDVTFTNSVSANTEHSIWLTQAIEKHMGEQVAGHKWKGNTVRERRAHFALLVEVLGDDFDAARLSKKNSQHIKEIVYKLPRNRNKAAKKVSLDKIARQEKGNNVIALETANKYMEAYIGLGHWLLNNGYISENPFVGMKIDIKKNAAGNEKRDDFTPEQMVVILNGLDCSRIKESRKKYQYWGPLIGAYTGARIGEITQLYVADVMKIDGIWCFRIDDDRTDKNLKTGSSRRNIPIHSRLIKEGFLEYVEYLQKIGQERLFPELTHDEKHGYGRKLSRWFNEKYLVDLGLKTKKHVFHSLRHAVTTQLFEAGVQEIIVKKILGHAQAGTTNTYYNHSKNLRQMQEALELLPY